MHLWLRDSAGPRTLLLLTTAEDEFRGLPPRALLFRAGTGSQAVVEFLRKDETDRDGLIRVSQRPIEGCLGLINVEGDVFLVMVTSATVVGNLRPAASHSEAVHRIQDVAFYCLNSAKFDTPQDESGPATPLNFDAAESVMAREQQSYIGSSSASFLSSSTSSSQTYAGIYEHPCAPLKKILSMGTFYYAPYPYWDLSTRLMERLARQKSGVSIHDVATFDPRFVWNEYIARSLLDFRERLDPQERKDLDRCQFIILAIQGYVGVAEAVMPAPPSAGAPILGTLALISRLGWKRAGARFQTRGVDDEGNVANFVETETMFSTSEITFSYVQLRGSVPLFWEQQGLQTFGHRIQITRPQQASLPAFERHFAQLLQEYSAVHAVNLLGQKEGEAALAAAYSQHLRATQSGVDSTVDIGITNFDFHGAARASGHDSLAITIPHLEGIRRNVERFGFTTCTFDSEEPITEQRGVFRTNCLDCLDRTNFAEDIISRVTLEQFLHNLQEGWSLSSNLRSHHRELWAENGDALSRIYAGTGALNTSFTRTGKRTLAGVLSDATKSVSRAYINNFQDKNKQTAIDLLLGNIATQPPVRIFDPVHDSVRTMLKDRIQEYSTLQNFSIFVGTYNLNGRPPSESLQSWLYPAYGIGAGFEPDIFVLGFQEVVPLNAQQIIQTDPAKKQEWERHIMRNIQGRRNPQCEYIVLRSEQLVGTALFIIVKTELSSVLRNVEAATRKTGLRGMSGNKGAVGIRFEYHDTSFCFLTAHLAAGHNNVIERNSDYHTIAGGLRFSKGRTIDSHDIIVWAADTNYRIDLENDTVRSFATSGNLQALELEDQLMNAMHTREAFAGYDEGPLVFAPTYRYDLHSDIYDTSEKQRIPAWTDRILYRGIKIYLKKYDRAELRGSDHRPVYAIFDCDVRIIDIAKMNALREQLLQELTNPPGGNELLEERLERLVLHDKYLDDTRNSIELPPPSSAEAQWWDGPDNPQGLIIGDLESPTGEFTNPFDSETASASSSEEELYRQVRPLA